jgi:hypothetical protein
LPTEAARAFEQTIEIAQRRGLQGAELKATIGLAELDHPIGRQRSSIKSLQDLSASLNEQANSADIERAKQLIATNA